jgi:hypothetical protein
MPISAGQGSDRNESDIKRKSRTPLELLRALTPADS